MHIFTTALMAVSHLSNPVKPGKVSRFQVMSKFGENVTWRLIKSILTVFELSALTRHITGSKDKQTYFALSKHYVEFLPSHSNSLLLSDGVSIPSRSTSVLSSSSSDRREPSLWSSLRLMFGAESLFFVFFPWFIS